MMLSDVCPADVCLSRTSGQSREQRPRKTKIGTYVVPVARDSNTTFKVKMSKVKITRPVYSRAGGCSGERGNVLSVGNYLLRCRLQARSAWRREALRRPQREGRWHIVAAARLQLVTIRRSFCV